MAETPSSHKHKNTEEPRPMGEIVKEAVESIGQDTDATRRLEIGQKDLASERAGLEEEYREIIEAIEGGSRDPGIIKRRKELERTLSEERTLPYNP